MIVRRGVTQEGRDVARGREAETGDERILRGIRELVEPALLEQRPDGQQPDRLAARADVAPARGGDGYRRIRVMHAHGEAGERLVQAPRGIGKRPRSRGAVVDHELFERGADDRRAILIFRNRDRDRETVVPRQHRRVPAAPDERVALTQQEAVAGVGRGRGIVRDGAVVQHSQGALAAADVDVVEHPMVAR